MLSRAGCHHLRSGERDDSQKSELTLRGSDQRLFSAALVLSLRTIVATYPM